MQPPVVGALIVASVALLVGLTSALITWYWNKRNQVVSVMPVLVFTRRVSDVWSIENVGKGPALNVVMRETDGAGKVAQVVSIYPISANSQLDLPWLKSAQTLAARYSDIDGHWYWSECTQDQTTRGRGAIFKDWQPNKREPDLRRDWERFQEQKNWGVK
jgi:hypothetical protein